MASFDVLTEPWIPVVDLSGGPPVELGITDALTNAHELAQICDPSPLIRFGLYRILIAFVMDAFQIKRLEDIEAILGVGRFDAATLKRYVETDCDRSRFDLFDRDRPFLQAEKNEQLDSSNREKVVRLFQHFPSGSFKIHFHHRFEDNYALSPAACARALAALPAFMTAGGSGYSPSINGAPPLYVLIARNNLFEELLLNSCALPLALNTDGEKVSWRSLTPIKPKKEISQFSLLHTYTWPCRRLRLIPSDGGACSLTGHTADTLVREMVYGPGLKAAGDWVDPQVAYRLTQKGRKKIEAQENRDIWRDTGPLMLSRVEDDTARGGKVRYEQPVIVSQFSQLCKERILAGDTDLQLEVFGLVAEQMKLFDWRYESLSLPVPLVVRQDTGRRVQQAMDMAETVGPIIGKSLKKAFPRDGKSQKNPFGQQIAECQRVYWADLRPKFDAFLTDLAETAENDLEGLDALNEIWQRNVRGVAESAFEGVVDTLGSDADALKRQVEARDYLFRDLNRALPATKPKKTTRARAKSKSIKKSTEVKPNV
jgi:CRISPR system Cascade subunit CasA